MVDKIKNGGDIFEPNIYTIGKNGRQPEPKIGDKVLAGIVLEVLGEYLEICATHGERRYNLKNCQGCSNFEECPLPHAMKVS